MKDLLEIDWGMMGAKVATLSDEQQALFFEGFVKELDSWETHYQKEMQMMYINSKLSNKAKEILKKYLSSLWYEDKQ